jgi:hypothetical protein
MWDDSRPMCLAKLVAHEALHTALWDAPFDEVFPYPGAPSASFSTVVPIADEERFIPAQVAACVHC